VRKRRLCGSGSASPLSCRGTGSGDAGLTSGDTPERLPSPAGLASGNPLRVEPSTSDERASDAPRTAPSEFQRAGPCCVRELTEALLLGAWTWTPGQDGCTAGRYPADGGSYMFRSADTVLFSPARAAHATSCDGSTPTPGVNRAPCADPGTGRAAGERMSPYAPSCGHVGTRDCGGGGLCLSTRLAGGASILARPRMSPFFPGKRRTSNFKSITLLPRTFRQPISSKSQAGPLGHGPEWGGTAGCSWLTREEQEWAAELGAVGLQRRLSPVGRRGQRPKRWLQAAARAG